MAFSKEPWPKELLAEPLREFDSARRVASSSAEKRSSLSVGFGDTDFVVGWDGECLDFFGTDSESGGEGSSSVKEWKDSSESEKWVMSGMVGNPAVTVPFVQKEALSLLVLQCMSLLICSYNVYICQR